MGIAAMGRICGQPVDGFIVKRQLGDGQTRQLRTESVRRWRTPPHSL